MNGNSIQPTVELATTNGNGFYPVYPMMGGYGNNGFFGGDGIWAIVLLALLFNNGGWGGFGGNGWNNVATTDYISSEFTQRDVNNGTTSVLTALSNGFADQATNSCNLRSDVLLSASNTQRDILMQTTALESQLATTSLQGLARLDSCCCDIKNAIRDDGERTRALITENTIQDLRDRLTAAQEVISDQKTESNIVNALRPYPMPAYLTASPFVGYGYGFNNSFYGNTIV